MCNLIYQSTNKKIIDDKVSQDQLDQYCQDMDYMKTTQNKDSSDRTEQEIIVKNSDRMVNKNESDSGFGFKEDDYNFDDNYIKIQELMT